MSTIETTANIFEQAARAKLRFETKLGDLTVEQLWDLPLTHSNVTRVTLDSIAVELDEQLEKGKTKSFVNSKKKDTILQLKFDVVKHIIDTREAENAAKVEEAGKSAQREKLDRLIAQKREGELEGKSIEELEEMRAAL